MSIQEESGLESLGKTARAGPATVSSIALSNFRNYRMLHLELGPRFNVLTGRNAQGKTNLLEALYVISTTRLLRGQRDAEAITDGAMAAELSVSLAGSGTTLGLTLAAGVRKRAKLNGLGLPRASDLIGRLPSTCICAEDLAIIRGEPADRRLFLDLELSALYPKYLRHFGHFKRALEQRNALLKVARESAVPDSDFEPWEEQIAEHATPVREYRLRYLLELRGLATPNHAELGQGEKIEITYVLRDDGVDTDSARTLLAENRMRDVARGSTSIGPHRDDVEILVGSREARLFGSQGQQRSALIAIKMASLDLAAQILGSVPMLLLDDILSDLDASRRQSLLKLVEAKAAQAVLTCTEMDRAADIITSAQVFRVEEGTVTGQ